MTSDAPESGLGEVQLSSLLHEPARLNILAALAPAEHVDFSALLRITGVSKSALSKHLSTLAAAGIVTVANTAHDKRGRRVRLSESGRERFDAYLDTLERIVRAAKGASPAASLDRRLNRADENSRPIADESEGAERSYRS